MAAVLLTGLVPLLLAAVAIVVWRGRRRLDFAATLERYHPELARSVDLDPGPVGEIAALAVDLWTPGAPRALAGEWDLP